MWQMATYSEEEQVPGNKNGDQLLLALSHSLDGLRGQGAQVARCVRLVRLQDDGPEEIAQSLTCAVNPVLRLQVGIHRGVLQGFLRGKAFLKGDLIVNKPVPQALRRGVNNALKALKADRLLLLTLVGC